MPLSAAQPALEAQILAAFKKAQLSKNPESATQALAKDLARAIHLYALQATINPGQAVVVGTPAGPGAGSTTSPGTVS
jgi:hypothetical protein